MEVLLDMRSIWSCVNTRPHIEHINIPQAEEDGWLLSVIAAGVNIRKEGCTWLMRKRGLNLQNSLDLPACARSAVFIYFHFISEMVRKTYVCIRDRRQERQERRLGRRKQVVRFGA